MLNDMDFDELKKSWQEQSVRIERLEKQNRYLTQQVRFSSLATKRSKLLRDYRILVIVAILMLPFIVMSFPIIGVTSRTEVFFMFGMAALVVINAYILFYIKSIDITRLSVRDALTKVFALERKRLILRYVSIAIAVCIISMMLYDLYFIGEIAAITGACVGGVVGAILGLRKEMEIRAIIKDMREDLEDALRDE